MKKIIVHLFLVLTTCVFAQVGINTTSPNAQLDIQSTNQANPSNTDGILIPKVDVFPTVNPGVNQNGMLVFLTTTVGTDAPGFYYWEQASTSWVPVGNNGNTGWKLTGNTATSGNFFGTINNQDLRFVRGNNLAGILGTTKTSFGLLAGLGNTSSTAAFGSFALQLNSGFANSAFGFQALRASGNGDSNSAFGANSLLDNTIGSHNTAMGVLSMGSNTTGDNNTAIGTNSLRANIAGSENTAIGGFALASNTVSQNTAIGYNAMENNTIGSFNTAVGVFSMNNNTTASNNNAFGFFSLEGNTTGGRNAAFGTNSLNSNSTGSDNVAMGHQSLRFNQTGFRNVALGSFAMQANVGGFHNVAMGYEALLNNIDSQSNIAIGSLALRENTSGQTNTAVGASALQLLLSANSNTAIGGAALQLTTTGASNTGVGRDALISNTTGAFNTGLGANSNVGANNLTNATAIGARSQVDSSNSLVLGSINGVNGATASVNVGIGTTTPVTKLHIVDGTIGVAPFSGAKMVLESSSDAYHQFLTSNASVATGSGLLFGTPAGNIRGGVVFSAQAEKIDFRTGGNTARMTILNSGLVGIGTTTPERRLHISNGVSGGTSNGNTGLLLESGGNVYHHFLTPSASEKGLLFGSESASIEGGIIFNNSALNNGLIFRTGGNTNRMAITSAGDVGIGTLTPSRKFEVSATGNVFTRITSSSGGQAGLELMRTGNSGNDWKLIDSSGELEIRRGVTDFTTELSEFNFTAIEFVPSINNGKTLGSSTRRWSAVFASLGTIQTSDAREKQDIEKLTYGLDKIMQLKPKTYKWIDATIDNHTPHLGFMAQDLQEILPEVVVDKEWKSIDENGNKEWVSTERLGVNYAEIIPVLVKAIQEQQVQIEELKNKIAEIENKKK
ncbi:tail fiber domain-containing protein [Flavobacterium sp.]|uniref:tail fiber domain-containing protein n=1 Tax=Flavobacterium sp. TaxID=239 RepID=UPI003528BFAD